VEKELGEDRQSTKALIVAASFSLGCFAEVEVTQQSQTLEVMVTFGCF
jgi:hypothetical protein